MARISGKDLVRISGTRKWQKIAGLRDILIHAYSSVDLDLVWDVVMNKLPKLEERVKALLAE